MRPLLRARRRQRRGQPKIPRPKRADFAPVSRPRRPRRAGSGSGSGGGGGPADLSEGTPLPRTTRTERFAPRYHDTARMPGLATATCTHLCIQHRM